MIADKTIMITGGAGFIGSHLARELATENKVTIVDDLSTGKMSNIYDLVNQKRVNFIQGSILDIQMLRECFSGAEFVFHLAAMTSVPQSVSDPVSSGKVNISGTLNVLQAAKESGARHVVFASSCAVYGDSPEQPKTEVMPPQPESPYAVTKLVGEHYCRIFTRLYGMPATCLRYFNVYGPGQDPASQYAAVIPKFIRLMIDGQSPTIYGDGEQTRDFVFVKDIARANMLAAESGATGVFNIGSGTSSTIRHVALQISAALGKQIPISYVDPRPGEIRTSLADISKARDIGYSPKYQLEEGLKETIESFCHEPRAGGTGLKS